MISNTIRSSAGNIYGHDIAHDWALFELTLITMWGADLSVSFTERGILKQIWIGWDEMM